MINDVDVVFVAVQGMTTLLCQRLQYLDKLKRLLISRIRARRPLFNVDDGTDDNSVQIILLVLLVQLILSGIVDCTSRKYSMH